MRSLLLIFLISLSGASFAQGHLLDSLESRLPNTKGVDRIETLNNLARTLIGTDPKRMVTLSHEALNLSRQQKYKKGEMKAGNNMGISQAMLGELDSSEHYFKLSLSIAKELEDSQQVSSIYDNLGNVYYYLGDYHQSLEMKFAALAMKEHLQTRPDLIISSRMNIANVLDVIGHKKRAISYYQSALKSAREISDSSLITACLVNLGVTYQDINRDSSRLYLEEGMSLARTIGDLGNVSTAITILGGFARSDGEMEKALELWQKAIELHYQLSDIPSIVNSENNLGKVLTELGRYSEALMHLNTGVKMAQKNGMKQRLYEGYSGLATLYARTGKYKKAFKYEQLYANLRDSVLNADLTKQLSELEVLYESAKKEKEIEALTLQQKLAAENSAKLEKEKQLIEARNERNQWIISATIGGLILVLGFAVYAFRAFKRKKQDNIKLEAKNKEILLQRNEIEYQHNLIQEKNKEITDSIQYAKRIQDAILPSDSLLKECLPESFIFYRPKDIVAGDFYWLEKRNKTVLFAACDCTGHGVPGAMVSVVCHNAMNSAVREFGLTTPGDILDKTREIVVEQFEKSVKEVKDGMDIALCSLEGTTLKYAGAHNPLWIIRKDTSKPLVISTRHNESRELEKSQSANDYDLYEVKADKQPIGKFDNPLPYTTHTLKLEKGDTVYIFSDGFADQFGGLKGKKLKSSHFKKLLQETAGTDLQSQYNSLVHAFDNWKGAFEQLDDVCVIGVRL